MNLVLRSALLPVEQELLIENLNRNLPLRNNRIVHTRRYLNPLGPGWSWILTEKGTDALVATASSFPRSFWRNGEKVVCAQVVDFAVEAPYRSLGPAVQLQRATFEPVDKGEADLAYDCPPHDRGMSTFVRLGMTSVCEVVRYAHLLRSDEFVSHRLGTGPLTRPIIAMANAALRSRRYSRPMQGIEVFPHEGRFDEEFSSLDQHVSSLGLARASRCAEELNWRYFREAALAPEASAELPNYQVLVGRRRGELLGYAILLAQKNDVLCIVDLFGANLEEWGGTLIEAIVDVGRRLNALRIDALCSAGIGLHSLLVGSGFRARERLYWVVPYQSVNTGTRPHSELQWPFSNLEVM